MTQNSNQSSSHRPQVTINDAKHILRTYFNLEVIDIKELNAYDDRNYWVKLSANKDDVLLKVTNESDSKNSDLVEAQTNLLAFLASQSFKCSEPIPFPDGRLLQKLEFPNGKLHLVRLLKFVQGQVLNNAKPGSNYLYYEAGQYIGTLNRAIQSFDPSIFKQHRHQWMLEEAVAVLHRIEVVENLDQAKMVQTVLKRFDEEVIQRRDQFRIGLIHGDFNEHNIIVNSGTDGQLHVTGVIDFGDVCYSYLIFDLAITMTYMMIHSGDIKAGGYVLKGFIDKQNIPDNEKRVLSLCIQARLCQSVVLGLYYYSLNPGNEYILSSQKPGWKLLEELFNLDDNDVIKFWEDNVD